MFLSSLLMWDSVRRTLRETKKEAPNRAPWKNAMEFLFNLVFIELSIERGAGNSKFCRCMNTIWGDIGNWYRLLSCQLFSQDILLWIHYSIDIQFIWHDKNQEHHRVYTNDQDSQIRIAAKWPHKQGQGQGSALFIPDYKIVIGIIISDNYDWNQQTYGQRKPYDCPPTAPHFTKPKRGSNVNTE